MVSTYTVWNAGNHILCSRYSYTRTNNLIPISVPFYIHHGSCSIMYMYMCSLNLISFWVQTLTQKVIGMPLQSCLDQDVIWLHSHALNDISWISILGITKRDGYRIKLLARVYEYWLQSMWFEFISWIAHCVCRYHSLFMKALSSKMNTSVCSQCPILFPCFFYNPYISLFNSKNFSFTCLRSFFTCYQHVHVCIVYPYLYMYLQKVTASFLPSCSICDMYIS